MDQDEANRLVIRQYPYFIWVFSLALFLFSILSIFSGFSAIPALFMVPMGLLLLAVFGSADSVTADRLSRTVSIQNKSLFGSKSVEIPFSDITNFELESASSYNSGRHSATYRMVVVKKSGEKAPVQRVYSSGYDDKALKARRLCAYLDLPGWEDKPVNNIQAIFQAQSELTEDPSQARSGVSSGVEWTLEVHSVGGNAVTHWLSTGFTWPGQFLLVTQIPRGQPSFISGGGILSGLVHMVYKQILGIYGFLPADTPGIETAGELKSPDQRLRQDYTTLTSDQVYAPEMLNTWAVAPLLRWAERHPLKTVSSADAIGQLAALYSPRGVHVAVLGHLPAPQVEELIDIGIELVKAQGGPKPA